MSKLDELIAEFCPNGVEYKTIDEIAVDIYRGCGIKRDQVTEKGIPCVRYGEIYTTYGVWFEKCKSHTKLEYVKAPKYFEHGDILFAITGESVEDIAKCCAYIGNEKCLAGGDIVVLKHKEDPKYISYALSTVDAQRQKSSGKVKSKVVHSSVPSIKAIKLPVPPLEIQREIVHILDSFTLLTAELTAELTARKKQYEFYRNKMLTFGNKVKIVPLADIADIGTGSSNTNEGLEEGKYPFYVRSQEPLRKNEYEYDETAIITAGDGVGVGKVFYYVEGKYALHQRAYRIHINTPDVLPRYYFHYMRSAFLPYIQKTMFQGSVASIRRSMLNQFPVPIPALDIQKRLVNVLDNFESICTDLNIGLPVEIEARQKQYEYYRDLLLTFAETGNTLITDRQTELSVIKLIQYVFGYAKVNFGSIATIVRGSSPRPIKNYITENCNGVNWIKIGDIKPNTKYVTATAEKITKEGAKKSRFVHPGDFILSNSMSFGRPYILKIEGCIHDGWLSISNFNDIVIPDYLYHLLNSNSVQQEMKQRASFGGAVQNLNADIVKSLKLNIPSLEVQKHIVSILDRFDTLCNDLSAGLPAEIEARQKQYEYYRDKLLSFKELPK